MVSIKKLPKSQIELTIEIPPEDLEGYFDLAAEELGRELKIDGFRPGRIPRKVLEEKLGFGAVRDRGIELAVRKIYVKVIVEKEIEAVGKPEIRIMERDSSVASLPQNDRRESLIFKAKVAVLPEVKLGNYKNLKVEDRKIEVREKEVDVSLNYLQKSRAKFITVRRPAKKGDRVEIDFETKLAGVKMEQGESCNHPLVIGEGNFLPGFEENLVGMKEGESKEFSLKVPKGHYDKNLSDRVLDFVVKMNLVEARELAPLNDDFARSLGDFKDLKVLKESIRQGIKKEKEFKEKERQRGDLLGKVVRDSEMELPEALVEIEKDKMLAEFKNNISRLGLKFEDYLAKLGKNEDGLKKDWQNKAEERIRAGLVLSEIAKREKIKVSDREIDGEVNKVISRYSSPREVEKKIDIEALRQYTEGIIRNEKVMRLLDGAAKKV